MSDHESRCLLASVKKLHRTEQGVFTSVHLQEDTNLPHVSNRTVRRVLNSNGYGYRQCRKKRQLTEDDCKVRLHFTRTIKREKTSRIISERRHCLLS